MKNKGTQFLVEAAAIGAIYVVLTVLFAPLSYGEVQIRFSEALTILYTSCNPGIICRMYHRQSFWRRDSGRYHLRKHCNTDRCCIYLQASQL